jgi:hypothetical protein
LRNRILHIGFLIGLLFIGKVGLGQNVYITAPANVCKGKPFALEIHSDQPISFQLQRRSTSTGNNWQPIDKFTTVPVGSDNIYTYNPTITVTTEYQIWYTTDLNFDPAFPNLASPAPVYLPQIVQINLFPTPIVASITSSAVCSGSLFEVIPTPSDGRYTCYTLVEKSRKATAAAVYEKTISEDEKLKILFDKKKFEEEYDKWKESRKN